MSMCQRVGEDFKCIGLMGKLQQRQQQRCISLWLLLHSRNIHLQKTQEEKLFVDAASLERSVESCCIKKCQITIVVPGNV